MSPAEQHFHAAAPAFVRRKLGDFPQPADLDVASAFSNCGKESRG